jgi:hypothetical protein
MALEAKVNNQVFRCALQMKESLKDFWVRMIVDLIKIQGRQSLQGSSAILQNRPLAAVVYVQPYINIRVCVVGAQSVRTLQPKGIDAVIVDKAFFDGTYYPIAHGGSPFVESSGASWPPRPGSSVTTRPGNYVPPYFTTNMTNRK